MEKADQVFRSPVKKQLLTVYWQVANQWVTIVAGKQLLTFCLFGLLQGRNHPLRRTTPVEHPNAPSFPESWKIPAYRSQEDIH